MSISFTTSLSFRDQSIIEAAMKSAIRENLENFRIFRNDKKYDWAVAILRREVRDQITALRAIKKSRIA